MGAGTASGYHALNYGHLIGEVIRRITGKRWSSSWPTRWPGRWAPTSTSAPPTLGRIAHVVPPPPLPFDLAALDPNSPAVKTFTGPPLDATEASTPGWRQADIGAANGHGNARSVARLQSASPAAARSMASGSSRRDDRPDLRRAAERGRPRARLPLRFGIGYGLPQPGSPFRPGGRVCFWGGWGGSVIAMTSTAA